MTDLDLPVLGTEAQRFLEELDVVRPEGSPDDETTAVKLLGHPGPVDAGVLSAVIDMIAGHLVMRHAWPSGISTTEMTISGLHRLRGPGLLVADVRLVSASATRGCLQIDLEMEGSDRGAAVATANFKLFRWETDGPMPPVPEPWRTGTPEQRLDVPLWQRAGVELDAAAGTAQLALRPEIANHVASLQGFVTVALLEAAALTQTDDDTELRSVAFTFLSQGRNGPFVATAQRSGPDPDVIVVTAVDTGSDDRPLAHAVFTTAPTQPT